MYFLEDRAKARQSIRELVQLATEAKVSAERGTLIIPEKRQIIEHITETTEPSRQVDVLQGFGDRMRNEHLARLKPLAHDEFGAFCEYVNPYEPPESKFHIWLTQYLEGIEKAPKHANYVLNVPPGHAKPLANETLVLMGDGTWKQLGLINVGDQVVTHTGAIQPVLAVHEQGEINVVRLRTSHGREIIAAPDHSFLAKSPFSSAIDGAWTPVSELAPYDRLYTKGAAHDHVDTSSFSIDMFELAAYFLYGGTHAYLRGPHGKRKTYRIFSFSHTKRGVAERVAQCARSMGLAQVTWADKKTGLRHVKLNVDLSDRFSGFLGSATSTAFRRIPDVIFRGSAEKKKKFISTIFSAFAETNKKYTSRRLYVYFKSLTFAQDFQALLSSVGVEASIDQTNQRAKVELNRYALAAYYAAGLTYEGPLKKIIESNDVEPKSTHEYEEVWGIEDAGRARCRCLTVALDHSFVANGLVVHNSTYASRLFVAWRMGRRPRDKVIAGGHSQRFVENEFGKKIRGIVDSPPYRDVFPDVRISTHTRAADQWALANTGGQYVCRGAGQAVHGYRANFIVVDDPYPNLEAAQSPVYRTTVNQWFFSDLPSRKLPGAITFLVMTRFHEDDLTGECRKLNPRLAPDSQYEIISIPAICFDPEIDKEMNRQLGEVLWNFFKLEDFAAQRVKDGLTRFSLLYQQQDAVSNPDSIASKLQPYDFLLHQTEAAVQKARAANQIDEATRRPNPPRTEYYRRFVLSVDCASKATERADYTVAQVWAETGDHKHYLVDQSRGKWEFNEMIEKIETLARKWDVSAILVEDKGQGTAYLQHRDSTSKQRRLAPAPLVAIQVPSNQGKEFRFDEISPLIEEGSVFIPARAPWIDGFLQEVGQFPESAHDDQVDAMSQYLRWAKGKRKRWGSKKITSMG